MQCLNTIEISFSQYRPQLLNLAEKNLNPILSKRFSAEDIVQETLLAACNRLNYFENNTEIPVYFKLRKLLFQTLTDIERKNFKSQKRDAYKELYVSDETNCSQAQLNWNMFAASITSPSQAASKEERQELLKKAMFSLPECDKQLIELRHFDGMSNSECAQVLKITEKNASIKYVRALKKLKTLLTELSGFTNG